MCLKKRTFTQRPKQTQAAYEKLFGHFRNDLVMALQEALVLGGIHELLSMRSSSDADLITKLWDSGQIGFEIVTTLDGRNVG